MPLTSNRPIPPSYSLSEEPHSAAASISSKTIRQLHALCQDWEDSQVQETSPSMEKWTRVFRVRFSIASLVAVYMMASLFQRILSWIAIAPLWIKCMVWSANLFATISIGYSAVALFLFVKAHLGAAKQSLQVFSPEDSMNVDGEIAFYRKLAQHPPEVIEYVAAWLEMRDAQMQNKLSWLKGSMAASSATLGVAIFGQGHLIAWFQAKFAAEWLFAAQILLLPLCLALFLGLTTTWNRTASTANRALRLQHFLKNRDAFQSNLSQAYPPVARTTEST